MVEGGHRGEGRRERERDGGFNRERGDGERRVRERDEDERPRGGDPEERSGRRGERDHRERDREGRGDRGGGDRGGGGGGDRERDRGDRGGDRERDRHRGGERDHHRRERDESERHRSSKRSSSPGGAKAEPRPKRKTNWDQPPSMDGMVMAGMAGAVGSGLPVNVDRQSRRLYVGNIPAGISEEEMQDFFNTAMITAKAVARGGNPVIAVQINVEKSYAFLEMRAPDEATAGMSFDGIMLHGHALKVRRPVDYIPAPAMDMMGGRPSLPAGAIVATNVLDSPFKIYIGGLPANLDEAQVKELLQTFGPLKAFNLVKDIGTGLSKGFAFCEYLDVSVTDRACAGLNGMKLGDKQLLVQRAALGAKNPLQSMGMLAPAPVSIPSGPLTASSANILNLAIPAVTLLSSITNPQNQQIKSRILCLLNMVALEEIEDEDEFAGVVEDVRDECMKFGTVRQVVIPRKKPTIREEPKSGNSFDIDGLNSPNNSYGGSNALVSISNGSDFTPAQLFQQQIEKLQQQQALLKPKEHVCSLAKVYVEYIQYEDCLQALHQLAGRRYNGHVVITSLFPEGLFFQGALF